MGLSMARVGDSTIGNCSHGDHNNDPYSGIIISSSSNVFSEGLGTAFITCTVLSSCGHTSVIVSGSSSVFINGLGAAYLGSAHSGTYYSGTVVSGAGSVFTG